MKMKLDKFKFTIFFMGGSQGSKPINDHLLKNYKKYLNKDCQILWQCGAHSIDYLSSMINHPNIHLTAFINDINFAYSSASLVVCRSGAISLAELTASKKAMILIPFPQSASNHQMFNANTMQNNKSALVVCQDKLKSGELEKLIFDLIKHPSKIKELEDNASNLAEKNATNKIIDQILELVS